MASFHGVIITGESMSWCPFPLVCMVVSFFFSALGRAFLGLTVHPVEEDAEKAHQKNLDEMETENSKTPAHEEQLDSFAVLTIGGHMLAELAIVFGLCKLPVAISINEALQCTAILLVVQIEMLSTKLFCKLIASFSAQDSPFRQIGDASWRPFLLFPNLVAWYNDHRPHGFFYLVYYCWSVTWYETYVNMLLAGPLAACGWPLALAALAVGFTTGFLNHGIVNGISNGVMATVFYISMAIMFSVSQSVLPVGTAHAAFYFRNLHAAETSVAFGHPLFLCVLLLNTGLMLVILKTLGIFLPPSLPARGLQHAYGWPTFPPSASTLFAAISFVIDCGRLVTLSRRSWTSHCSTKQNLLDRKLSREGSANMLLGRTRSGSHTPH